MITPHLKTIGPSPLRLDLLLIPLTLVCFALSPQARAICQEGCLRNDNTVLGDNALINNTNGDSNTATGSNALARNSSGEFNTATGANALTSNTGGVNNTATGANALTSNTDGADNTANGAQTLTRSTGFQNTATGSAALEFNTTGSYNTATGTGALLNNTIGSGNTGTGDDALRLNTTGLNNTAVGFAALDGNTTGSTNTANGVSALAGNTSGSNNIALGFQAGVNLRTGNNNIDIGNKGVAGEANTIRIGKKGTQTTTVIAGISGAVVAGGVTVVIDTNGHLGTTTSSARFKEAIKPMNEASEAILELKPVTFRYKKELDADRTPQFGLTAEDVEKVNPALVARDEQGKPYTVRYEAVNAMLLNEFLKEHLQVQEQQKEIDALRAELREQRALIRTVSARLEMQTAPAQTVANSK